MRQPQPHSHKCAEECITTKPPLSDTPLIQSLSESVTGKAYQLCPFFLLSNVPQFVIAPAAPF
jgi:hypothetical protein